VDKKSNFLNHKTFRIEVAKNIVDPLISARGTVFYKVIVFHGQEAGSKLVVIDGARSSVYG
jgi:hypothetical protein